MVTSPSHLSSQHGKEEHMHESLKSDTMFQHLKSVIATGGSELVNKVRAVYLWKITKDGQLVSQWSM